MWIIPKNLQLSSGAPDTAGFISDLNEQSQICASSLMVRSKPSPARTWSQKWRRDSWTQHLSGRILKPSHAKPFETEWTCLWPVIPASRSAQQASGSEPKTLATSGRTSQEQLELFAPDSVSSRMSKATSPSDSAKSSETWEQSVTRRRGEYSARRSMRERLTSESGSSSWPSPVASEVRQGFQDRSRGMKGSQESLTTVVIKHGQAAPASSSSLGSRQGLSEQDWRTPTVAEEKNQNTSKQIYLQNQVGATPKQWATPIQGDSHLASTPEVAQKRIEEGKVTLSRQMAAQWATPQAHDANTPKTPEQIEVMRANGHGVKNLNEQACWGTLTARDHIEGRRTDLESNDPNGHSGTYLAGAVKQWATPQASDPEHSGPNQRDSSGRPALPAQAMQWGTPTARDHKSGRGNEEREYKELTPMVERTQAGKLNPRWVETLMGLPVGWVMPSCKFPVTIAPTSCASSATESCQPPQNELF